MRFHALSVPLLGLLARHVAANCHHSSSGDPVLETLSHCTERAMSFCQEFIEPETSTVTVATVYPTATLLCDLVGFPLPSISSACSHMSMRPKIVSVTHTAPPLIATPSCDIPSGHISALSSYNPPVASAANSQATSVSDVGISASGDITAGPSGAETSLAIGVTSSGLSSGVTNINTTTTTWGVAISTGTASGTLLSISGPSIDRPNTLPVAISTSGINQSDSLLPVGFSTFTKSAEITFESTSVWLTTSSQDVITTLSSDLLSATTSSTEAGLSSVSPSTSPECLSPKVILHDIDITGFNQANAPFSATLSCGLFDVTDTVILTNFATVATVTITPQAIYFAGFSEENVLLSIIGFTTTGAPFFKSYQLVFGSISMPVQVVNPDGTPAVGAVVKVDATTMKGFGEEMVTDSNGEVVFHGLPPTTISLVAKTSDNSLALTGLAARKDNGGGGSGNNGNQITVMEKTILQLSPLIHPSEGASFDNENGTVGWTGSGTRTELFKRAFGLEVLTNYSSTARIASGSFPTTPGAKKAFIKFKFITSEVPGGYFGSQYNDYFSVSIRSSSGSFATYHGSMNDLGRDAFDSVGATDWFTLTTDIDPGTTEFVAYDVAVSNVADNLYQSSVLVSAVGDSFCDGCYDCNVCPDLPFCSDRCQNPSFGSCDFYPSCVEEAVSCSSEPDGGYAMGTGGKQCKAMNLNIPFFSASGQNWILGATQCQQLSLVPTLSSIECPSCGAIRAAGVSRSASCYEQAGVCGLGCSDVVQMLILLGFDGPQERNFLRAAVACHGGGSAGFEKTCLAVDGGNLAQLAEALGVPAGGGMPAGLVLKLIGRVIAAMAAQPFEEG